MSKVQTIKATTTNGFIEVQGKACFLMIGGKRHKFFLQNAQQGTSASRCEVFLTDYLSGRRIASLTPVKLRYTRTGYGMTDRAAAIETLDCIIEKHGETQVIARLSHAEKIN